MICGPTIRFEMWFAGFIVIRMARISTGSTTLSPRFDLSAIANDARVDAVFASNLATFVGFQIPIERKRLPIPAITARTLFTSETFARLRDFNRRGSK